MALDINKGTKRKYSNKQSAAFTRNTDAIRLGNMAFKIWSRTESERESSRVIDPESHLLIRQTLFPTCLEQKRN